MDAQVWLNEWNLSCIYGINCPLIDIDANDLDTVRCQDGGGWQANVAQPNDCYSINCVQRNAPHIFVCFLILESDVFCGISPELNLPGGEEFVVGCGPGMP